jgi:serine/threonine protein kinase
MRAPTSGAWRAVLYELITGRAPFTGETTSHIAVAILESQPAPLSHFAPNAPSELQRIVRKSLAKDPDERYQTARDLLIDLKSLRQELESATQLDRSAPPELSDERAVTRVTSETNYGVVCANQRISIAALSGTMASKS